MRAKAAPCFFLFPSPISLPWSWGQIVAPFFGNIPTARVMPRPVRPHSGVTRVCRRFGEESPDTVGQDSRQETLTRRSGRPQGRRPESLPLKPGRGGSSRRDGSCHREYTAACAIADSKPGIEQAVRVKRWGKSPPRRQRCRRQGKPNPVQDKIGDWTARPRVPGMSHPPALACG